MEKLFHISEEPDIKIFHPRPSPQFYESIKGDVVFAISDKLLHNYLLPRDCPRVTYYTSTDTTEEDRTKFFGNSKADYIINVEPGWKEKIEKVKLYKYEFSSENFVLLDKIAGYYISSQSETPISVTEITNVLNEFSLRNVELRFLPGLQNLSAEVSKSSLKFSIIRMKNLLQKSTDIQIN